MRSGVQHQETLIEIDGLQKNSPGKNLTSSDKVPSPEWSEFLSTHANGLSLLIFDVNTSIQRQVASSTSLPPNITRTRDSIACSLPAYNEALLLLFPYNLGELVQSRVWKSEVEADTSKRFMGPEYLLPNIRQHIDKNTLRQPWEPVELPQITDPNDVLTPDMTNTHERSSSLNFKRPQLVLPMATNYGDVVSSTGLRPRVTFDGQLNASFPNTELLPQSQGWLDPVASNCSLSSQCQNN
ncbi:uncharacterized protein BDR25DRAFT_347859 [Lindgomyces ingoldianus]|uniref:Uncharacterized protein n=1 Tax=Lindgomyces ingoldianus TaxID=673940 RepID=A0ACB6RFK6_9PLEO|nr:uncharacterized protein BDR25DRAFT_347859 [Lindgomyces ingoldianus]KAF2477505.1 hypothetical protein BDR25DRAFT_347859 [Lindgomyces ingoldianus]